MMESTGEVVGQQRLAERVGWIGILARQLADGIVAAHWTEADLDLLAGGVDQAGRRLPAKGWMALRRLGWTATVPTGVYLPDRARRAAEELAARALRLVLRRRAIIAAVLATWPTEAGERTGAGWAALRALLPAGTTTTEVRDRGRQVRAWAACHGGRLPAGLTELEPPPQVPAQLLLAAADRQLVTVTRTGERAARLRVQLPRTAPPATRADWAWHGIGLRLPPTVAAGAALSAPTLRVADATVRVDVPFRRPVPIAPPSGHRVALGLDWGVNTLLTGSLGCLSADGRVWSDGRRLRFDATAVSAKLGRLRRNRERVAARRDHYTVLLGGLADGDRQRAVLQRKAAVLAAEHQHLCARIRRLNRSLGWAAARWAVDQALALDATAIYLEDLATLEARGRRGTANARLSGQVRGSLVEAVRHLAARAGIAVATVPARGTSSGCPRCLGALHHAPAPDRAGRRGWRWAVCGRCGLSCDRDHAAAERIVARGLLGQAATVTDRRPGAWRIPTTVDGPVARARRPHARPRGRTRSVRRRQRAPAARSNRPTMTAGTSHPTPVRLDRTAAAAKTSRRAPDRRAVPAPAARLAAGKRPAGPMPQTLADRAAVVGSGSARDRPHQPGRMRSGAAWGFHQTVRATAVVPLGGLSPRSPTATPRPECQDHRQLQVNQRR
jgi:Putative transposase DNA-binding domain